VWQLINDLSSEKRARDQVISNVGVDMVLDRIMLVKLKGREYVKRLVASRE
jgi:hypothetical protein